MRRHQIVPYSSWCKGFVHGQDGVVAVITAILIFTLLGIVALSFDLGRDWNLDTQLQHAADASALACATQLDHQAGALSRATDAAMGLVQNDQNFATDGGAAVTITSADIVFYSSYSNGSGTQTTSDTDATYCQVSAGPRTVAFSFAAAVAGPAAGTARALAVAENQDAYCIVPPMMICNPLEDPNNTDPNSPFNAADWIGHGLVLKSSSGGGLAPGNFGLLALNNQSPSLAQIRAAWARIHPLAECFGSQVTTKPGQSTAVRDGVNVRFGIYPTNKANPWTTSQNSLDSLFDVPSAEPDVLQNPEYMPAMDTVKGLHQPSSPDIYCDYSNGGGNGWNDPSPKYDGTNTQSPAPQAMGFPRDLCAYNSTPCAPFGDGHWDFPKYWSINHPTAPAPATIFSGYDTTNWQTWPSRYDVYEWELQNYPQNLPANTSSTQPEVSHPICHQAPSQPQNGDPDRRVITVAVVNCAAVAGLSTVSPVAWVKLFLTEPMGSFNGNNDLYAEVVGPADDQNSLVVKHVVQLVE